MENTNIVLLTSTNYFQWKSYMEDSLRSKELFKITLGIETSLDDEDMIARCDNKNDQANGLVGISISPDLRFHLDGLDSLVKSSEKLNTIFGIKNEIRAFQLENELLTLDPSNFPYIEYYLSKFKNLKILLVG